MKITEQTVVFLSDNSDERKNLLKHLRNQTNPGKAIDKLAKAASRKNTIRKVMSVAVRILTLNIVKHAFGVTYFEHQLNGRIQTLRNEVTGPKPLADFVCSLSAEQSASRVDKAIQCPWTNFNYVREYLNDVVSEDDLSIEQENLRLVRAIKKYDFSTSKEILPRLAEKEQEDLVRFFLYPRTMWCSVMVLQLLESFPHLSKVVFKCLDCYQLEDVLIKSEKQQTKQAVKDLIDAEYKERIRGGRYTLLMGEWCHETDLQVKVLQRVCDAIKDLQQLPPLGRTDPDEMERMFCRSCLFEFPASLNQMIAQEMKNNYLDEEGGVLLHCIGSLVRTHDNLVESFHFAREDAAIRLKERMHEVLFKGSDTERLLQYLIMFPEGYGFIYIKLFNDIFDFNRIDMKRPSCQKLRIFTYMRSKKFIGRGSRNGMYKRLVKLVEVFPEQAAYVFELLSENELTDLLSLNDGMSPEFENAWKSEIKKRCLTDRCIVLLDSAIEISKNKPDKGSFAKMIEILQEVEFPDDFSLATPASKYLMDLVYYCACFDCPEPIENQIVRIFKEEYSGCSLPELDPASLIYAEHLGSAEIKSRVSRYMHKVFYGGLNKEELLRLIDPVHQDRQQQRQFCNTFQLSEAGLEEDSPEYRKIEIFIDFYMNEPLFGPMEHVYSLFRKYRGDEQIVLECADQHYLAYCFIGNVPNLSNDLVYNEIQKRMQRGDFSYFNLYGELKCSSNGCKEWMVSEYPQKILALSEIFRKISINDTFKKDVQDHIKIQDLSYLFALSCLIQLPEKLVELMEEVILNKSETSPGLLGHLKSAVIAHSASLGALCNFTTQEVKTLLERQVGEFLARVMNVSHLPLLLKAGSQDLFTTLLKEFMEAQSISSKKQKYIIEGYEFYFIIKNKRNEILEVYKSQIDKHLYSFYGKNGEVFWIHFENYTEIGMLEAHLDDYVAGMEKVIEAGLSNKRLQKALEKGFDVTNPCLDWRTEALDKYLMRDLLDSDYVANIDEIKPLFENMSEYLRVYQNVIAKGFAKENREYVQQLLRAHHQKRQERQSIKNLEALLQQLREADSGWFRTPGWVKIRKILQSFSSFEEKEFLKNGKAFSHKHEIVKGFEAYIQSVQKKHAKDDQLIEKLGRQLQQPNIFENEKWYKDDEWKYLRLLIQSDDKFFEECVTSVKFKDYLIRNTAILTPRSTANGEEVAVTEAQVDEELRKLVQIGTLSG